VAELPGERGLRQAGFLSSGDLQDARAIGHGIESNSTRWTATNRTLCQPVRDQEIGSKEHLFGDARLREQARQ
jgi:hypothetical protein